MTNELKPVAYLDVEPSAKGLPAEEIIKHAIMFSTRWHFPPNTPEVLNNPIHAFYSQQQVDQLQAQIAELQAKIGGISGVDLKNGWISWDGMGDRPVSGETIVDLRNNRGTEIRDRADVFNWRRNHQSRYCYIIAYRVVKP